MKSCPTCHRQYEDETLRFCLDDGTSLFEGLAPTKLGSAADATLHLPGHSTEQAPTRASQPSSGQQPTMTSLGFKPIAASPDSIRSEESRRSAAVLWVVGAVIIAVAAIAVALIITRNRGQNGKADNRIAAASPAPTETPAASTPAENANRFEKPGVLSQSTKQTEISTPPKAQPAEKNSSVPTPAPAEKAAPRGPISGGVMNGKAVRLAQPAYPAIAKSAHVSGQVTVQVLVDEEGNVVSAHAVSGHPLLQQSAVSAARSSKFSPTKLSGQPVKVSGVIVYNFVAQ